MPKRIQSSGRKIVLSVRAFCEEEKGQNAPLIPFANVRQLVVAMTGLSEKHNIYVDIMLEAHGHKVARLPPYHCEINAIEFMWSLIKRNIAAKNIGQEPNNIVNLTEEAFRSISIKDWQKQCEHVRHIEDKFLDRDGCMDAQIENLIINLHNESDTESDTTHNSSSSDSDE